MTKQINEPYIALIGNPNSGKTAIFNALTGLNQKVSNYPGITVEQKLGNATLPNGSKIKILDLPGTYSLTPESIDERIVSDQIISWMENGNKPSAIVSVVDASNLSRNLYLTSQLLDLGIPVVVALNMMDRVKSNNNEIDDNALKNELEVADVIPMSASEKWGIEELKVAIGKAIENSNSENDTLPFAIDKEVESILHPLTDKFKSWGYSNRFSQAQALRIVTRKSVVSLYENIQHCTQEQCDELVAIRENIINQLDTTKHPHRTLEASLRYAWLDELITSRKIYKKSKEKRITRSEKADSMFTHKWLGPVLFLGILYFIFQSIFTMASYPMDLIDALVGQFSDFVMEIMNPGMLRDIMVDGIIAGIGAIVIFLPQILILIFFLSLLEDTGYMARVAFMMDRFMTSIGMHGKSVLPLMSGYACAIPGVMATRTIDSWKERLITILVLPLTSCSARLPVYALMIGAFIPDITVFGFFKLQGLTMVIMYLLGTGTAFIIAIILSKFIDVKGQSSFLMELPPYRVPLIRSVMHQVYTRGKLFVLNAGKIIMAISIVLWFMATFPKVDNPQVDVNPIHTSYAGQVGHALEPIIEPLGFDWKIGIGLITSFAAREVVVSTLATIYNIEGGEEDIVSLTDAMNRDINPKTGKPQFTALVAISLMVFFVFAAQCMATFAIIRSETNSWKWPAFMIIYMSLLAYFASLLVYQGGQYLGFA